MTRRITSSPRRALALAALSLAAVTVVGAVPADAATRIKFPRGSFCGSYAGNYRSGREFVMKLAAGQRFTVRNTGAGNQTTWSVTGPTGELDGDQADRSTIEYYTDAPGDHYVYVTSTARRSSVQFCAY
jgi:hypothetical protein